MKAKLIFITTCAFVFTLLTNCTIEKRVFQKGYHIEWKKKSSNESARSETTKLTSASDATDIHSEKQLPKETAGNQVLSKDSVISDKKESEAKPVIAITNTTNEPAVSARKTDSSDPVTITTESPTEQAETAPPADQDDDDQPESTRKTFEPVGIVSFGLYFVAVILGLLAIPALNAIPFLVFSGVLLILSLIFGIISVVRSRRNRDLYYRNFFGFFGLIASGSTLILGIIVLTWVILGSLFYY